MALTGSGTAKYQAQNILCFFYDECDPYYFTTSETRAPEESLTISDEKVQPEFTVYPNPAGNWVMIELTQDAFDQLTNAQIVIMDISGKVIHQTNLGRTTYLWETGNIENGLYLITIKSEETIYQTKKVIINR